ncbi:MAG: hypothetical protein ABI835_20090 [Chloroflexota bacterium]
MFSNNHDQQQPNAMAPYLCPTSPWTELFQAASSHDQQPKPAAFDSDDQRPTLDALSDIYNRGYE